MQKDVENFPMPEDPSERALTPWWKAKKWCCQIFSRVFARFGHPKYTDDYHKSFTTNWAENVVVGVTESMMTVLTLRCSGQYCSDRVIQLAMDFVETALELSVTFKVVKPHVEGIVQSVIFPLVSFNAEDNLLWEEDPHEYVICSYVVEKTPHLVVCVRVF